MVHLVVITTCKLREIIRVVRVDNVAASIGGVLVIDKTLTYPVHQRHYTLFLVTTVQYNMIYYGLNYAWCEEVCEMLPVHELTVIALAVSFTRQDHSEAVNCKFQEGNIPLISCQECSISK